MKGLVITLVLALAATSQARVAKRDTATPATPALPSLEELISQAEQHMNAFASVVRDLFTPGERQDQALNKISEDFNSQTQTLARHVQTLVDNLGSAMRDGENKLKDNVEMQQAAQRLNNTLRELVGDQTATDAERATSEISESMKNAVQTIVEEATKISRNVADETAPARDELALATRNAVKQSLDIATSLIQQFRDATRNTETAAPAA